MKNYKYILGVSMCMLLLGSTMEVFAYEEDYNTDVYIDAKQTLLDVTVPTSFTMMFNEDGSSTLPNPEVLKLTNNSKTGAVIIRNITMSSDTGWTLANETQDMRTYPVDSKTIQFAIGKNADELHLIKNDENTATTGSYTPDGWIIAAESEQEIYTAVNRPTYTNPIKQGAYNLSFSVAWN